MKGICFIEPLLAATVEGYKTQTRRTGKPRFVIDDVVFLKEPYAYEGEQGYSADPQRFIYKYDYPHCVSAFVDPDTIPDKSVVDWKNKLFMPARAARHFIEITGIRSEKLQDISNEDCIKEGIWAAEDIGSLGISYWYGGCNNSTHKTPQEAYAALIDKINGRGTWTANPTVTVYEYKLKLQ